MLDIRNTLLMAKLVKALKRASTQRMPLMARLVKSWDRSPRESMENSLFREQIGEASARKGLGGTGHALEAGNRLGGPLG